MTSVASQSDAALRLAVVGHANTGKTSLLQTLLRRRDFGVVSPRGGTTRVVDAGDVRDASGVIATILDTPGLEDSLRLRDAIDAGRTDRHEDPRTLLDRFLESPAARDDDDLGLEAASIRAALDATILLYAIDAREDPKPRHLDELAVLAATARPVVPVLNFTARPDAEGSIHGVADLPQAEVLEAVDGRLPKVQASVDVRPGDLFEPRYPFAIAGGEVGCFLSHRKAWQKIVDEGWDTALVVEDDLEIDPDTRDALLRLIARHAGPQRFIRIPPKDREPVTTVTDREEGLLLFTPRRIGLQTTAQLVGREAAKRLLACTERLDRPVDSFLQMHWASGQKIETILPNGCREKSFASAGSTVQNKTRSLGQKLRAEILRARYRRAIARRPQST
jgi:GR25 family glycosyltransferase involved in LPS biosynthesis